MATYMGLVLNAEAAAGKAAFGAFGESLGTVPTINSLSNPVQSGWQGLPYDQESRNYDNGPRAYDPRTGRFLIKDPIGLLGGDSNLYRYVWNNPVSYKDPLGLSGLGPIPGTFPFTVPPGISVQCGFGSGDSPFERLGKINEQLDALIMQSSDVESQLNDPKISPTRKQELIEQYKKISNDAQKLQIGLFAHQQKWGTVVMKYGQKLN